MAMSAPSWSMHTALAVIEDSSVCVARVFGDGARRKSTGCGQERSRGREYVSGHQPAAAGPTGRPHVAVPSTGSELAVNKDFTVINARNTRRIF